MRAEKALEGLSGVRLGHANAAIMDADQEVWAAAIVVFEFSTGRKRDPAPTVGVFQCVITEVVTPDVVRPPTPSTISADLAVRPTGPTKLFEGLARATSPSGAVSDVVPPMMTAAD